MAPSSVDNDTSTSSVLLDSVETEPDVVSVSTSHTTKASKLISSIHKHCRPTTREEKDRTNKTYFCRYCPPQDAQGHHASTNGLRSHLKKQHGIEWSPDENNRRASARDEGERSIQDLYERLLAKGEIQGLEGEILKRTVQQDVIKQALLDLIIIRRLPFSCVEWPELHAFVKVINKEAPSFLPSHHSTITDWIHGQFSEAQDIVRRVLQSAKTNIHISVDIWTSPSHALLLGICASFVDVQDEYRNPLIALRTVHSQSGHDQWETLRPVLEEYGIATKIGAVIADNAQANDLLCRAIGSWLSLHHHINWTAAHQRIRCQGHVINLVVQSFLFSKQDEKLMGVYDEEEVGDADDDDEQRNGVVVVQQAPQSAAGGRRAKQTAVPQPLSDEKRSIERDKTLRLVLGPLGKLHNHVVHIRRSANRTTWFVERAGKMIPLDNRTRWNSWFSMLNTALEDRVRAALQLYVEHYAGEFSKDDLLTTSEWIQLRTIRDFLQYFHEANLFLQGDRTTLERVLSTIDILRNMIASSWDVAQNSKDTFISSRLYRAQCKLAKYAEKLDESPYYLAARGFDPECRTSFLKAKDGVTMTSNGVKLLYIVRRLWERFRDQAPISVSDQTGKSDEDTVRPEEQFSAFHRARRRQIEQQTRPQSQDEFDNYIGENPIPLDGGTTSLQWWCLPLQCTRFPRLSRLAIEVLAIPGMSDKPERVFSGSRRRVPWDRTRTTPRMLEETECLKDWKDHGVLNILL